MLIRINVKKVVLDKDVFDSLTSLIGPTIAAASFYYSPFIKDIAKEFLDKPMVHYNLH